MTREELEEMGRFTKWHELPCEDCSHLFVFNNLRAFGPIVICSKCHEKALRETARNAQPQLFDDQQSLF